MIQSSRNDIIIHSRSFMQTLAPFNLSTPASPSYRREDVAEELSDIVPWQEPISSSLDEVCSHLMMYDPDTHLVKIRNALLKFSIQIEGLPECPDEDLLLAVYILMEEVLGVQGSIKVAARFVEGRHSDIVGVMFTNREQRNDVLIKASRRLKGTSLKFQPNYNFQWILDN